ncbi:protein adenylyltransferase SelO family protein [Ottowia sp.]|uniref:protein adenylyltransferase SelO n=1 Tax=Ottowia sp. TaxID=1898956 RepID=UPI002BEB53A6|nr:YdiU family protein [Ottowia sp.]HOB65593.1 YdiU family protein [Ottowia sp.]HPZ56598.1 YdiU family protein [Ottowia sp.]HQD46695.1 YdiU family protein [Ottowia sp.]
MQDRLTSPPPATDLGLDWRHGFERLGTAFHTPLAPMPLRDPYWVAHSEGMARELGLANEGWRAQDALQAFAGNRVLAGSRPLASVYSGHQFGVWAGQLGDGRAHLLGEVRTPAGDWLELQLKGSGLTPYSRMGDGRAVLRSSIREFLASEAMHALGVPTTRALCITGSDQPVRRETVETAAVVTRVAPSFIRFGHFEHFNANGQVDELRRLSDYVIDRFYPDCRAASNPVAALLAAVTRRTAELMADWQAVGFMHGVMNTDNMSILGLTIDYGPFQFMDGFDPAHICNHSDHSGRYAYHRQPQIGYWNLFALAQALMPLIDDQQAALDALEPYKTLFAAALDQRMAAKLGLPQASDASRALVREVLELMAQERTDWTIFWRRLSHHVGGAPADTVHELFVDRAAIARWLLQYQELIAQYDRALAADLMLKTNPAIVLRNHMAEEVIARAKLKDFQPIQDLLALLETPFDEQPAHPRWADWTGFPPDWASHIQISCSS